MPDYLGLPDYDHASALKTGVLLVNLGTPASPAPGDVRRFLAEFLADPRVVKSPRWLWWLALHGVILRIRPRKSAHAYQQIWTPQGSPLLVHSTALSAGLQQELTRRLGNHVIVGLGMSYGAPAIAGTLEQMYRAGVCRLVVLPLYPQYSGTTTASVFDRVTGALQRFRWIPELRFIAQYHDDSGYIDALAASIREHWSAHGQRHLLFSFHGIPRSYLLAGDPYHCQSLKTARLVSERLGLEASDWSVSFQSQVGRAEWLRPYTDELLLRYAKEGPRRISVVCPGFATDCLETLEEIEIRNRALFLENGGEAYDYVPALNATAVHVGLLADLVTRNLQGWPIAPSVDPDSKGRALRAGAQR